MKSICVYCGSSAGSSPAFTEIARSVGQTLAEHDITLIYGGGNRGVMKAVADGALAHGGKVIGVIPHALKKLEVSHHQLTELHVVDDMHQRKAKMATLADAFVALPGGFGTLEEIFESITHHQLHFHSKPCAFLNIDGFYDKLLEFLNHMAACGFIKKPHRDMILIDTDFPSLLQKLLSYKPHKIEKLS